MIYDIYVPVTGYRIYTVDTDSSEEAKELVASGEGDCIGLDSLEDNMDTNNWEVDARPEY